MAISELQRLRMQEFFQNNRDRYAYYGVQYRDNLKLEMIKEYGGCCKWCEETDPIVLTLDHINDDSCVEKELYGLSKRGGTPNYARLKKEGWPKERFQLLCFNCNSKKEHYRKREAMEERWGTKEQIAARPKRAGEGLRVSNTSGFKGVFWNTQKGRWQVKITVDKVARSLGFFHNLGDAAEAYRTAAIEAWGLHANVASDAEINEAKLTNEPPTVALQTKFSAEDLGL